MKSGSGVFYVKTFAEAYEKAVAAGYYTVAGYGERYIGISKEEAEALKAAGAKE